MIKSKFSLKNKALSNSSFKSLNSCSNCSSSFVIIWISSCILLLSKDNLCSVSFNLFSCSKIFSISKFKEPISSTIFSSLCCLCAFFTSKSVLSLLWVFFQSSNWYFFSSNSFSISSNIFSNLFISFSSLFTSSCSFLTRFLRSNSSCSACFNLCSSLSWVSLVFKNSFFVAVFFFIFSSNCSSSNIFFFIWAIISLILFLNLFILGINSCFFSSNSFFLFKISWATEAKALFFSITCLFWFSLSHICCSVFLLFCWISHLSFSNCFFSWWVEALLSCFFISSSFKVIFPTASLITCISSVILFCSANNSFFSRFILSISFSAIILTIFKLTSSISLSSNSFASVSFHCFSSFSLLSCWTCHFFSSNSFLSLFKLSSIFCILAISTNNCSLCFLIWISSSLINFSLSITFLFFCSNNFFWLFFSIFLLAISCSFFANSPSNLSIFIVSFSNSFSHNSISAAAFLIVAKTFSSLFFVSNKVFLSNNIFIAISLILSCSSIIASSLAIACLHFFLLLLKSASKCSILRLISFSFL